MFIIAEILSSTYKIEHFSRFFRPKYAFLTCFRTFLTDILRGLTCQKTPFLKVQKMFLCKKILGLFVHVQRWLVQKNTGTALIRSLIGILYFDSSKIIL